MPPGHSDSDLSEQFASHFMNKIEKICDSLSHFDNFEPDVKDFPSFENIS